MQYVLIAQESALEDISITNPILLCGTVVFRDKVLNLEMDVWQLEGSVQLLDMRNCTISSILVDDELAALSWIGRCHF